MRADLSLRKPRDVIFRELTIGKIFLFGKRMAIKSSNHEFLFVNSDQKAMRMSPHEVVVMFEKSQMEVF